MIHIILIILKIAGIILLSVIGLVVAVLLLVLFAPVSYRAEAQARQGFTGSLLASWLWRVARLEASYDSSGVKYVFRILWFTIFTSEKTDEGRKSGKRRKTEKRKAKSAGAQSKKAQEHETKKCEAAEYEEHGHAEQERESAQADSDSVQKDTASAEKDSAGREKNSKSAGNDARTERRGIAEKIKKLVSDAADFRNKAGEKLEKFDDFIHDETNYELVRFMKKELGGLFTHIAPVRYNINIRYGASSPDITGKVTGAAAVAMAFVLKGGSKRYSKKNSFEYVPVFTEKIFEADIFMKGRITPGRVLLTVWHVYSNKIFKNKFLNREA